jgi:hypothetical protein
MTYPRYFAYVWKHKFFVFRAGLKTKAPIWNLVVHDLSKFSRVEFGPYARRFASGRGGMRDKSGDPEDFRRAWDHHWQGNPHHWDHWLVRMQEIPERYVREMVADWMGAGRASTGRWEVAEWYDRNRDEIWVHPNTREMIHKVLREVGAL